MAIKVLWGPEGPYAIAETPAEALELIKLGSNGLAPKPATDSHNHAFSETVVSTAATEKDRVEEFFSSINNRARKFLLALAKH